MVHLLIWFRLNHFDRFVVRGLHERVHMETYIFKTHYLYKFDRLLLRDALLCYRGELKKDLDFLSSSDHIKDCSFCNREEARKCPAYYVCFSRILSSLKNTVWL